jgi:hypothetical protein
VKSFWVPFLGELTRSAGKNKEGEEASGTITVPEVAHDTEEDEYVVCCLRPPHFVFRVLASILTDIAPSLR